MYDSRFRAFSIINNKEEEKKTNIIEEVYNPARIILVPKNNNGTAIILDPLANKGIYVGTELEVEVLPYHRDLYTVLSDKNIVDTFISLHEQLLIARGKDADFHYST